MSEHRRDTATDILVMMLPGVGQDDPHLEGFLETQAKVHVFQQFANRWPGPRVEITSIDMVITDSMEAINEFYASVDHMCANCATGRALAQEALKDPTIAWVSAVGITYREEWPDGHDN